MVAAGTLASAGPALVLSAVAGAAVVLGLLVPLAATMAVVAVIAALALSEPDPVVAGIAGLAAAGYLVVRHADGDAAAALTMPTVLGALGASVVAVLGATVPFALPWVPLVAPLAVVAAYVLVLDRYVGHPGRGRPLR
ncbi:hypothetical protein H7K45_09995 [Mycobacterium yunnanensis]|uniref:Integral membrane protein n=2 Tax=Mycobacterium yunnanensis TaxID=368477 RepID=A0A9X2YZG2_9MYCO|nr:hypothetical protein [Mycobacterium yunnanensis]